MGRIQKRKDRPFPNHHFRLVTRGRSIQTGKGETHGIDGYIYMRREGSQSVYESCSHLFEVVSRTLACDLGTIGNCTHDQNLGL